MALVRSEVLGVREEEERTQVAVAAAMEKVIFCLFYSHTKRVFVFLVLFCLFTFKLTLRD